MPTTYTNGLKLPDLGSIDWFNAYKNNIDILDPIVGTVNGVATTYAPISHNHDASEITSGTIDIARLPPAALERLTTVADQTARYALTTSTVQLGDTVKQLDTGIMYLVVDTTKLNSADGYVEYSAGTASKAIADEDGTSIKTGYVNVAGDQTVSGNKNWTGSNTFNGIKSTGAIRVEKSTGDTEFEIVNGEVDATVNTLSRQDDIRFYDKNTKITGGLRLTYTTDTGTKIELYARSWKADGTASYNRSLTIYTNCQTGEYYTTLETNFLPKTTSAYSLGSSTYQWASVYAQTYYYNGTAWGLDKSNTWTGNNTFTSTITTKTNVDRAVAPSSDTTYGTIICRDKNGSAMFRMQGTIKTDLSNTWDMMLVAANNSYITFFKYTLSGSSSDRELRLKATSVVPEDNATADLGISTNQWKSVYAQTYYYNGTAWGLDKYNTWTNSQVYKLTGTEVGSTTAGYIALYFTDKNNANLGFQRTSVYSDGRTCMSWKVYNTDSNSQPISSSLEYYISKADAKVFAPGENATIDLGTSTYKWKTLNGVNPGALSLPDYDRCVDKTSEIPAASLDGNTEIDINDYFPNLTGWINIVISDTSGNFIRAVQGKAGTAIGFNNSRSFHAGSTGGGFITLFMPIVAGTWKSMKIQASSVTQFRFYPCLGNV